jgi:hypothetical protein
MLLAPEAAGQDYHMAGGFGISASKIIAVNLWLNIENA